MNAALNLDALYPVALTRCCKACKRQLPLESFALSSAKGVPFRRGTCKECRRARDRQWYAGHRPQVDRRHLPPRNEHEKACDAALWEFRMAGSAFQGCRL